MEEEKWYGHAYKMRPDGMIINTYGNSMKTLDAILKEFEKEFTTTARDGRKDHLSRGMNGLSVIELEKDFLRTSLLSVAEEASMAGVVEEKFSSMGNPFCRNCNHKMVESTGVGKIVFPWQCPNCNNYQEGLDDKSTGYNNARTEALQKREDCLKQFKK